MAEVTPRAISTLVESRFSANPHVVYAGNHPAEGLLVLTERPILASHRTNHLIAPAIEPLRLSRMHSFMEELRQGDLADFSIATTDLPRSRDLPKRADTTVGRFYIPQVVGEATTETTTVVNDIGRELGITADPKTETHPVQHLTIVSIYPDPELAELVMKGVQHLDQDPEDIATSGRVAQSVSFLHTYIPDRRHREEILSPLRSIQ